MGAFNVVGIDPTVIDDTYKLPFHFYNDVVKDFNFNAGKKNPLDQNKRATLDQRLANRKSRRFLGGTATTTARTAMEMAGGRLDYGLVTAINDADSEHEWIRNIFKAANIDLLTHVIRSNITPEVARTRALIPPSSTEKTTATDPGNFNLVVTSAILEDKRLDLSRYDVIHLLGSNREDERLGARFVDELLIQRWQLGMDLWLNLPTHEEFATPNGEYFRTIIPSANVVMANMEELRWTYGTGDNSMEAIYALQKDFNPSDRALRHHMQKSRREQVAFITDDKRDAFVVTADRIHKIRPRYVDPSRKKNPTGSGDTALGAFIAGYVSGLPFEQAAEIGMILAAHKLCLHDPCLPAPRHTLRRAAPGLLKTLDNPGRNGPPPVIDDTEYNRRLIGIRPRFEPAPTPSSHAAHMA